MAPTTKTAPTTRRDKEDEQAGIGRDRRHDGVAQPEADGAEEGDHGDIPEEVRADGQDDAAHDTDDPARDLDQEAAAEELGQGLRADPEAGHEAEERQQIQEELVAGERDRRPDGDGQDAEQERLDIHERTGLPLMMHEADRVPGARAGAFLPRTQGLGVPR